MIIALGHKSRVGKDTAALILEQLAEKFAPVRRCGFAWQIKSIAAEIYSWAGVEPRTFYEHFPAYRTQVLPALGLTPVQIWTALGDHLSQVHPLTLVEPVLSGVPKGGLLIVPDLRRQIEIEAVRRHGGIVVKIVRPDAPANVSAADTHLDTFDEWDHIIYNDGTQEQLRAKLVDLLVTHFPEFKRS